MHASWERTWAVTWAGTVASQDDTEKAWVSSWKSPALYLLCIALHFMNPMATLCILSLWKRLGRILQTRQAGAPCDVLAAVCQPHHRVCEIGREEPNIALPEVPGVDGPGLALIEQAPPATERRRFRLSFKLT